MRKDTSVPNQGLSRPAQGNQATPDIAEPGSAHPDATTGAPCVASQSAQHYHQEQQLQEESTLAHPIRLYPTHRPALRVYLQHGTHETKVTTHIQQAAACCALPKTLQDNHHRAAAAQKKQAWVSHGRGPNAHLGRLKRISLRSSLGHIHTSQAAIKQNECMGSPGG